MKINKYLDKIFIVVFLLIIFLPNIGLIQKTDKNKLKSLLNRDPYSFPDVKVKSLSLTDFSAIEKWYADKIIFITQLSKVWSNFNYTLGISIKPGQAIIGKNQWLFLGNDYALTIDQYTGKNLPSEDEMLVMAKSFQQMSDVAKQYKVPFLVVVAPDKQDIYPEYLPYYVRKGPDKTRLDLLDKLLPELDIDFIDLRSVEFKAKTNLGQKHGAIYLAGDSHWNYLGAYVAYASIANYTQKHFKMRLNQNKVAFIPRNTTNTDLTRFLQVKDLTSNSPIPNLSTLNVDMYGKSVSGILSKMNPYEGNLNDVILKDPYENINMKQLNKSNALLISDSFSNYLNFYFHNDFYNTIRIHNGNSNYNLSSLIERYHPKIIVFQIVERNLMNYSNNFNPFLTKRVIDTPNSIIINANIDNLELKDGVVNINGWGYIPNNDALNSKTYLRLSKNSKHFDFLLNTNRRPDINGAFTDGKHLGLSGFNGQIKQIDIPNGIYKASVIIENGNISSKKDFNIDYVL